MAAVDEAWLFERGGLHDAYADCGCVHGADIVIRLDDEWANERGLTKPEGVSEPLALRFVFAVLVEGVLEEIAGGKISEARMTPDGQFSLVFQDRGALQIRAVQILTAPAQCLRESSR